MNGCDFLHRRMRRSLTVHSLNAETHYHWSLDGGIDMFGGRCKHCHSDVTVSLEVGMRAADDVLALYGVARVPLTTMLRDTSGRPTHGGYPGGAA